MKRRGEQEIRRLFTIEGTSFIGVVATCTESLVLVPRFVPQRLVTELERALGVPAVRTLIAETSLVGCLVAGNSNGLVFSPYALDSELELIEAAARAAGVQLHLSKLPEAEVLSAAGNIILANDSVALVHPEVLGETRELIHATLGVEVHTGTIGGVKTVGMAAVATNKGVLAHRNATYDELAFLEQIFELPVGVGSVNFGVPLIGAALLANSRGYAVGDETSGAELGRIVDTLGFEEFPQEAAGSEF